MPFTRAIVLLLVMRSSVAEKRSPPQLTDSQQLEILNSGIFALTPDAMGITFYIHLLNKMPFSLDVATRMWECCESLDEGKVDCSHIHLIGGYKGVLLSGDSRNVTLFYPNLYVYNRVGECLVGVWYREQSGKVKELRTKINFDTTLTPRHVAPAIAAYYEAETVRVRKCAYFDEDALDKCKPVDCSRKYNGQRLFYSVVERRCLQAPKCNNTLTTTDKNGAKMVLPSFVYAPEGNICEDLEPIIKEEDIRMLNSGRGADQDLHPSNEYDFIVCHHGNKSLFTGQCRCNEGWTSTTNHIRPTTLKVHLCTENQFEPRITLQDALLEFSESVHLIAPRFVAALRKPTLFKIQGIIFGTALVMSILFSIIFTLVYKRRDGKAFSRKRKKRGSDGKKGGKRRKHVEIVKRGVSAVFTRKPEEPDEATTTPDEEETLIKSPTHYTQIRSPYFRFDDDRSSKFRDYAPDMYRNPTESIGFSTRTIPALEICRFTASSMTPHEKYKYLGQFEEQMPLSEFCSIVGDDRPPNSNRCPTRSLAKASGSRIKASEYPRSRMRTASSLIQRSFVSRRKRHKAASVSTRRHKNCSTVSRSVARLTYSSLPSSDSLLSLEESSQTASPCTSSEDT